MAVAIKLDTLFVGNLPKNTTSDALHGVFSEIGEIKRCNAVMSKDDETICKGFGFVTFGLRENVDKALQRNFELNGTKLRIQRAGDHSHDNNAKSEMKRESKTRKKLKSLKKPRLIIRNTPFKADEKFLKKIFLKFGSITDVKIPTNSNGRKRGFAFIQYDNMKSAINALNAMNAQELLGRTIAVDFAVAKHKYELAATENKSMGTDTEKFANEESESEEEASAIDDSLKKEDDDTSDEESPDKVNETFSDDGNDSSEEESKSENGSDNEDSDAEEPKPKKSKKKSNDAADGRTLFVRNVSFSTEQEDLQEEMEKFGPVQYALLCIDRDTERPKGTAFVRFEKREDAEKCLNEVNSQEGGLILDGRQLFISQALTHDQAKLQMNDKNKQTKGKDKRNLYLAREGLIRLGSEAAQSVSKGDLAKRMQRETAKRNLLRNLHNFVSSTRLCVHNLPFSLDDSELKKVFLQAVDNKSAKITEARIMKDSTGKSKGYGFVAFTEHEDALKALRSLNNNPHIFTVQRRPVVEFSVEDRNVLNMKEKRLENSRKSLLMKQKAKNLTTKTPFPKKLKDGKNVQEKKKSGKKPSVSDSSMDMDNAEEEQELLPFAGFHSKEGVKKLPSHVGPKIRHKERKQQKNKKAKKMLNTVARDSVEQNKEDLQSRDVKKSKKRKFKSSDANEEKKFERLVKKYKSHLLSEEGLQSRKKWFEVNV